ncbi:hypothetical protein [Candidatus Cyanaurora vandensis]|uniref:hypothetical protein n=1 Tax=Candidatus Cyanaurora vandensis TaxID=2714958 RepID=UPI00257CAD82|nr:hypothetical protein [Candidatus Cyanaurora vandensis]
MIRLLKWLSSLFVAKEAAPSVLTVAPRVPPSPAPTRQPTSSETRIAFWQNAISANFRPEMQELVIYFCVTRSASRAQNIQQSVLGQPEIAEFPCRAEVLRLVGWEFDKPHVMIQVSATGEQAWTCEQVNEAGLREPFGYVVLSSAYTAGLVNSMTIARHELRERSVRFLLNEDSSCLRLSS